MCGICGIVSADPTYPIPEATQLRMRDILAHRGPDDAGLYVGPGIVLGSRRLAIVDLSDQGHMPMATPDGRYWITYNGEVYNYRELRPALEARGYTFRSNTDTEVLLYLYASEGAAMLDRLNGMFAFAIWDAQERTLFIARDRLGIKPAYYALQSDVLYFASEEKALVEAGLSTHFDTRTWEELLCFRYVAGEQTPYNGIKRLLPGHYLSWKDGNIRVTRWWHLGERAHALKHRLPPDPVQWFKQIFASSVSLRRISDVPLGVLLSGGLDSSSVAATLGAQAGSGVASFTVRFSEPEYDEGPLAAEVANQWQLTSYTINANAEDLLNLLEEASWFNDEPLAHGNDLYLFAIARYAKPRVTVLLSGEGSDEIFGGYVRYRPLRYPFLLNLCRPWVPALVSSLGLQGRARKLAHFLRLGSVEKFICYNASNVLPPQLMALGMKPTMEFPYREAIFEEACRYSAEPLRQAMYLDQHTFLCSLLDRNDRMTMGNSIECRVPFLDYRLVEMAAAIPTDEFFGAGQGKWIVRKAMAAELPESILRHHKWGFGVPWTRYLRQNPAVREALVELDKSEPILSGPFDRRSVRKLVDEFLSGTDSLCAVVLELLMIVLWHKVSFGRKAAGRTKYLRHRYQPHASSGLSLQKSLLNSV